MNSNLLMDMVYAIANTPGKKAKKNMLIPELKQVLEYAYDPFKTYGVRSTTYSGSTIGAVFNQNVWNLFDHLAARTLTGNKAQQYVNATVYALSLRSAELFKRILDKDLRCGVSVKSINDVFPGLVADAITMQPNEYDSKHAIFPCYLSLKLRGCRGYYKHKHNTIYSRTGKPYHGLEHITNALMIYGHDFDGELLVPGIPFETGAGLIRNKKKTLNACYAIFDAPEFMSTFRERERFYKGVKRFTPSFIQVCTNLICHSEEELFAQNALALENGYEGVVIKNPDSLYKPGYSNDWLKLKELAEPIDLEVVDVYEGKGKYVGLLGGAIVRFNNADVRVGGGWSDHDRKYYYDNANELVGHTILVKYQEKTKHGSLRNPIFVEVRDDK